MIDAKAIRRVIAELRKVSCPSDAELTRFADELEEALVPMPGSTSTERVIPLVALTRAQLDVLSELTDTNRYVKRGDAIAPTFQDLEALGLVKRSYVGRVKTRFLVTITEMGRGALDLHRGALLKPTQAPARLYVDVHQGDDCTGERGARDKPFRTLHQAFLASIAGDEVHLRPGVHDHPEGLSPPKGVTVHGAVRLKPSTTPAVPLKPSTTRRVSARSNHGLTPTECWKKGDLR